MLDPRVASAEVKRVLPRAGAEAGYLDEVDGFDADFGVDEWHGHNAFIRDRDRVFRTYFINNRGDEAMGSTWSYLDLAALGRQETWEDSPEGYPQSPPYNWWNWHDEYDHPEMAQGPMKGWGMLRSEYRAGEQAGSEQTRDVLAAPSWPGAIPWSRSPTVTGRSGQ